MTDIQELPQAEAVKKLTREQISDLRNSFEFWQQDYDPVHDKEQHDMFAMGVVAMNEMLAVMDGEAAERREWMARGVESFVKYNQALSHDYPHAMVAKALEITEVNAECHCSRIRAG